jgi:hypothetical protein
MPDTNIANKSKRNHVRIVVAGGPDSDMHNLLPLAA